MASIDQNVLLLSTWNDGEAAIIRQLLDTYGIRCQVISDVPHSVFPLSVDGLGEIRILVAAGQLDEARAVLAEHLRDGLSVIDGGADKAKENGGHG
jgi:hypothetical protein